MKRSVRDKQESRLGKLAIERGVLTHAQLEEALAIQDELRRMGLHPKPLAEIFIDKGFCSREQISEIDRPSEPVEKWPQIPGYQIQARLGRGGMGIVYRARQESLDRTVAIKILSPRFAGDEVYCGRFLREARAVAKLNHKNVIAGIDVGKAGGNHFFVMEYVDGETAGRRLERCGPLPEGEVVSIGLQMAQALSHAAEHRLVHRDIKPQNIILTAKGVAKLCDLGLAKQDGLAGLDPEGGKSLGTPYYISPEQAKGPQHADIRSDIYSLGATLFHLATGDPPFDGPSALVIMTKQMTEPSPSARKRNRRISPQLDRVIGCMMSKRKEDRYATPEDLTQALRPLERGGRGPVPLGRRRRRGRVRRRSTAANRPGIWIAAVGILLVGAVALVIGTSSSDEKAASAIWSPEGDQALKSATQWIEANPEQSRSVGIRRLQQVIERYPGTSAAARARDVIASLGSGD